MKFLARPLRLFVTALTTLVLAPGFAHADLGDFIRKVQASDGTNFDSFGISVAVSGTTAIVGCQYDDDNGVSSGSAYLFDLSTGSQIAKLLPSDGSAGDAFGNAVAISGSTAIVGAAYDDPSGNDSGSAYLFNATTGAQIAKLTASDGSDADSFGWSVGISGSIAIVGAFSDDDDGSMSGSAYLFDAGTGAQLTKLTPSDGFQFKRFGLSVAMSGSTAIVGAPGDLTNGSSSGAAYLFDVITYAQLRKLLPSDGVTHDQFGSSVAISGTNAVIGAIGDDDNGSNSGSAYVFDVNTGSQVTKLLASDGALADSFGYFVGISGPTAVVGAPLDDGLFNDMGSAYLFDAGTGAELTKLVPGDAFLGDKFGWSVGISGSTVVGGSPYDDPSGSDSGSCYAFEARSPMLFGDVAYIPLSTGGEQRLSVDLTDARAGWWYFLFGSVTGTTPGIDLGGGIVLPLNWDEYFNITLRHPGYTSFRKFRGQVDSNGLATARLILPALPDPTLYGVTMHHAYLCAEVLGYTDYASNAIPVVLVP